MRIFSWHISVVKVKKGENIMFFKTSDPKIREKLQGLATGELALYKKRARKKPESPPEAPEIPPEGTGDEIAGDSS